MKRREPTAQDLACFGPSELKTPGAVDWCWQKAGVLKHKWRRKQLIESEWNDLIDEIEQHRAFEKIPPDKPYGSLEALLEAEIGVKSREEGAEIVKQMAQKAAANPSKTGAELAAARAEGGKQGGRGNKKPSHNTDKVRRDYNTELTRQIAAHHPAILEKMKAGEYSSVREAGIDAGIVKPTFTCPRNPRAAASMLRRHFTDWELAELKSYLGTERKAETISATIQTESPSVNRAVVSPHVLDPESEEALDSLIGLASTSAGWTERDARYLIDKVDKLLGIGTWARRLSEEPKTWERFCSEVLGYDAAYIDTIREGVGILQSRPRPSES